MSHCIFIIDCKLIFQISSQEWFPAAQKEFTVATIYSQTLHAVSILKGINLKLPLMLLYSRLQLLVLPRFSSSLLVFFYLTNEDFITPRFPLPGMKSQERFTKGLRHSWTKKAGLPQAPGERVKPTRMPRRRMTNFQGNKSLCFFEDDFVRLQTTVLRSLGASLVENCARGNAYFYRLKSNWKKILGLISLQGSSTIHTVGSVYN